MFEVWETLDINHNVTLWERLNRTIRTAIRSFIKAHKDWDKNLPEIQYAINSVVNEVSEFPPTFLVL